MFGGIFVWFWNYGDGGIIEYLWECPFFFNLLKKFKEDGYKLLFVCLVEFAWEAIWSWTCICREYFYDIFPISFLVIGLFLLDSVLAGCNSLESCLFLLGCQFVGIQLFIVFSYGFLGICSCDFSFFVSYFVCLGFFSLLLGESGQRFFNFIYLFKELALDFIDFFHCLSVGRLLLKMSPFNTSGYCKMTI